VQKSIFILNTTTILIKNYIRNWTKKQIYRWKNSRSTGNCQIFAGMPRS